MTLKGMPEAVSRIETALAIQESICVYGDYDVDGITATCRSPTTCAAGGR